MKNIPFVKYTCYGNNFVIIDETVSPVLSEEEKSQFAHYATNTSFGIGCDNLLVIQRCTDGILSKIDTARGYWENMPASRDAEFVFRMFEPNGDEAFCCGNGLMSVASLLYERYGIESAKVMTEVPLSSPHVLDIGRCTDGRSSWVNLGPPRRVPVGMVAQTKRRPIHECIDVLDEILIRLRSHDLRTFSEHSSLKMSGYLVFTGEPHLVVFPHDSFSESALAKPIFLLANPGSRDARVRSRISAGSWLVRRIGALLNDRYHHDFPAGINVNFAHVDTERGTVVYRCFERGIERETLACGTGAMAVAVVAKHLGYLHGSETRVLPYACRWSDPDAEIRIIESSDGDWHVEGAPILLMEGDFRMAASDNESDSFNEFASHSLAVVPVEEQVLRKRVVGLDT
jgi:diaminopimelate epimerase